MTGGIARLRLGIAALVLALATAVVPAQAAGAQASGCPSPSGIRSYVIPGAAPEGIDFDARTCFYYTGSSAEGTIFRGRPFQDQAEVFLPSGGAEMRNEAYGIRVDERRNRLFVAGGNSGRIYVYNLTTKALVALFQTGAGGFINDIAMRPNGDAYVTDSFRPIIFRIRAAQIAAGGGTPEQIPLAPEVPYEAGFNANGIVSTPDAQHLLFTDTNSGGLYRLTPTPNPNNRRIRLVRDDQPNADGLEITGGTLYTVRNMENLIVKFALSRDATRATLLSNTTYPRFRTVTALAMAPGRRLVLADAEFFQPNGPPFFVHNVPRP